MSIRQLITSNDYSGALCTLVYEDTGEQVRKGDQIKDFRGDVDMVVGGCAPRKQDDAGLVYRAGGVCVYAGVYGLKWVRTVKATLVEIIPSPHVYTIQEIAV